MIEGTFIKIEDDYIFAYSQLKYDIESISQLDDKFKGYGDSFYDAIINFINKYGGCEKYEDKMFLISWETNGSSEKVLHSSLNEILIYEKDNV